MPFYFLNLNQYSNIETKESTVLLTQNCNICYKFVTNISKRKSLLTIATKFCIGAMYNGISFLMEKITTY